MAQVGEDHTAACGPVQHHVYVAGAGPDDGQAAADEDGECVERSMNMWDKFGEFDFFEELNRAAALTGMMRRIIWMEQ